VADTPTEATDEAVVDRARASRRHQRRSPGVSFFFRKIEENGGTRGNGTLAARTYISCRERGAGAEGE
jgi:hypothetical protein